MPDAIISASTPSDCFYTAYEAMRIAIEHMTPVILLSDGYIANGAEPWKFPSAEELLPIKQNSKQNWDSMKSNSSHISGMKNSFVHGQYLAHRT
jgi:2-oxoglutarate ferredoxin oxidoreductase subunit alpha